MRDGHSEGQVYLRSYLAPFAEILGRSDVTDVYVNKPGELWAETLGGTIEHHHVAGLDSTVLARLAGQIAAYTHQGVNREHPILSATLPGGERVQVIVPPATRGDLALAIRKHVSSDLGLSDYVAAGAFENVHRGGGRVQGDIDTQLQALLEADDLAGLLATAAKSRRNILVSGGTSTGKTTFLNALIREIPPEERLIFMEDTPELHIRHRNAIGLLAARSALGEAAVTAEDLLNASLRMRPDRIILGELRGPEAYTFLRAVNTGHPGSMTTVHADSPERAVEQIALLVLQGGTRLRREDVLHYVRSTIDVFVQLTRVAGRRSISEIRLRSMSPRQAEKAALD
ncbi:P-type DNA transfer ATPase VirB11 [Brevundimonas sp.]|uniref:P-type DNA transfer ATPase VirB11 n=1 Tax=Brevundimonas sp. TaxID=1871086 RepID=UPI002D723F61|nr:P-type DNA transfer ATPase VirB11 [Brevundimonas sp.]HYC75145.1 P-type DNA transfer ATPase VirB11 [Brevundimonas sp.]